METKWAEENLQTIRTLMERSALYRRALAPIMIFVGTVGIVGGIVGWQMQIDSGCGFVALWSGVASVALIGTFALVRQQALKDSEPVWSPPAKRISQALFPPFVIGAFSAAIGAYGDSAVILIPIWCLAFGCAICSAGFFMPRGMKLFGWLFILIGFYLITSFVADFNFDRFIFRSAHLLMAAVFGGLHLAYGIYLYFTEKKNPVA